MSQSTWILVAVVVAAALVLVVMLRPKQRTLTEQLFEGAMQGLPSLLAFA